LWWLLLALGSAVFVLFVVLLLRGLNTAPSSEQQGRRTASRLVVGGGVILPLVLITVVFIVTIAAMRRIPETGASDRLQIEIIGHQWWWEVTYPEHRIETANEMYIPVGSEIDLHLVAADVVHSFWVPALAGKTDLLPDESTSMVIAADEAGEYRGACAEFCGLQHTKMAFTVVAVDENEFRRWLEQQGQVPSEPTGVEAEGRSVFLTAGCDECHTISGTADGQDGPDLTHISSRLMLAAGTLPNTSEHLRNWVSRPQHFKEGVDMEDIGLSSSDLDALVAYLESLE
jgi:cytochrome c oxidase subunit 2